VALTTVLVAVVVAAGATRLVVVTETQLALELVAVYTAAAVLLADQILMLVALHTSKAQEELTVVFALSGPAQLVPSHQLV